MTYHLVQYLINKNMSKEFIEAWKFGARKIFQSLFHSTLSFQMKNLKPDEEPETSGLTWFTRGHWPRPSEMGYNPVS